jgi:MFS family permease
MFFISVSDLALYVAVILVGFCEGGCFVLAGIIAHEDYGSKKYSRILGIFMTGAAFGILVFEKLVFDWLYLFLTTDTTSTSYGKWNKYIFIITLLSSATALVMSVGAFARIKKSEREKTFGADFVNF